MLDVGSGLAGYKQVTSLGSSRAMRKGVLRRWQILCGRAALSGLVIVFHEVPWSSRRKPSDEQDRTHSPMHVALRPEWAHSRVGRARPARLFETDTARERADAASSCWPPGSCTFASLEVPYIVAISGVWPGC